MEINFPFKSILHINDKGGSFGGTEEYINSLTVTLNNSNISSYLIYSNWYGPQVDYGYRAFLVPGLGLEESSKPSSRELVDLINEIRPDVIYIHNIYNPMILDTLKDRCLGVLVWYVHDHYLTCLTKLRALKNENEVVCARKLSTACIHLANSNICIKRDSERIYKSDDLSSRILLLNKTELMDAIVVISDYMRDILLENNPNIESKLHLVPRQVRYRDGTQHVHSCGSSLITYSGRIVYEKGLHLVIQALACINSSERIILKIAGVIQNVSYWNHCQELILDALKKNRLLSIEYCGHLSYSEVDSLYCLSDIVVVPSIWGEPSGTVAAEAMAHGCAVIASNVGGIGLWLRDGKTGVFFDAGNIISLKNQLQILIDNPDLRSRLGLSGGNLIRNYFNEHNHLLKFSAIIESCISIKS